LPSLFPVWPGARFPGTWGSPPSWLEASQIASLLGLSWTQSIVSLYGLRPPEGETLAQVADFLDRYMRSPAFLQQMRFLMRFMTIPGLRY
jgi:hypothetical protein